MCWALSGLATVAVSLTGAVVLVASVVTSGSVVPLVGACALVFFLGLWVGTPAPPAGGGWGATLGGGGTCLTGWGRSRSFASHRGARTRDRMTGRTAAHEEAS